MSFSSDIRYTQEALKNHYRGKYSWLYIMLLFFVIIIIISLPFINVDVTSQCRGVLRSRIDNVPIISLVQGKIEYINLKNNKHVKEGDTLLCISSPSLEEKIYAKESILEDLSRQYIDVQSLLENRFDSEGLMTSLYKNELRTYNIKLNELYQRKNQSEYEFDKLRRAYTIGVASKAEYENAKHEHTLDILAEKTFIKENRKKWLQTQQSLDKEIISLKSEILQLIKEKHNYILVSPITGDVVNFKGHFEGTYLSAGTLITEISPDTDLIVECLVSTYDIGSVYIGQMVRLQFDAFNYNQWGLGEAEVIEIDNNLTVFNEENYIRVLCQLHTESLSLKDGFTMRLKKGMTLTARFYLTNRSLWDLLYDTLDDWLNPKLNF